MASNETLMLKDIDTFLSMYGRSTNAYQIANNVLGQRISCFYDVIHLFND